MRIIPVLVLSLVLLPAAAAQSAQQLDIFRNLTPEQQEAVLEHLGSGQDGLPPVQGADRDRVGVAELEESVLRRSDRREEAPAKPLMGAYDTVVIDLSLPGIPPSAASSARSPADEAARNRRAAMIASMDGVVRQKLDELIQQVLARNPYELDRDSRLNLPGLAPIGLGGLTEAQATQRLSLEPAFLPLEVYVTKLPVLKTGVAGLKRYGYELFDNAPSTFSPVTDVPVPADYIVGGGDELRVQLYGTRTRSHNLVVDSEGVVSLQELGPIRVGGLTFTEARRLIQSTVAQRMIGVEANVSMGDTRSIRVFVSGEARQTGSFVVDGRATMTSALFASGGVKPIGSLRDIRLIRQNTLVRRLDLYDFLMGGELKDDAKLQSGDVILIPPVGRTIAVDGEVKRPAIYELLDEGTLAEVVQMAGGFTSEADVSRVSLTRIDSDGRRVIDVNLGQPTGRSTEPSNGDELRVARVRPQVGNAVTLEGHVHRPGLFAWRDGLRLTDVISSVDELRPGADQHYVLIRRETGVDRRVTPVSPDLAGALSAPGSAADVLLQPRDRITVFDLASGRDRMIQALLTELRLQSGLERINEVVEIAGSVLQAGEYPLEQGMRVSDLLRAGGGLLPSAYGATAELTRYAVDARGTRQTELVTVDLAAIRRGDAAANLPLQPFDRLVLRETPDWHGDTVTLRGEVVFPGTYVIGKGDTLREVIERAGGLTSQAFPEGGAFTRSDLRALEQEQLDRLAERMRSEFAAFSLQAATAGQVTPETLLAAQSLLAQIQGARATGRFIIDLPALLANPANSDKDVLLRGGDELVVPKRRQEVTVIGEVQNATSHLFSSDLERDAYIAMSGGVTRKADKGRIYVVRADGRTATRAGSRLTRNFDLSIKPGDTIVVPVNTERMPRLQLWQTVTQILYNLAVSVAAVNSF